MLSRKYGLSVDNILDAELVDAVGRVLNRESVGEDLI
jgi:FAD/FMN-containing dehydrogenase